MKLAIVHWVDTHGQPDRFDSHRVSWTTKDELEDLTSLSVDCVSVGFIYKDTERTLTIVPTIAGGWDEKEQQYGGWVVIPKACITDMEVLEEHDCGEHP